MEQSTTCLGWKIKAQIKNTVSKKSKCQGVTWKTIIYKMAYYMLKLYGGLHLYNLFDSFIREPIK